MSYDKVFKDGNLVDVNVSMWTAERKLQPEDLGLDGENLSQAFSLGHKKLLPSEVINKFGRLASQARTCLLTHSYSFGFGGARFVPKKRFETFAEEMDKIIAEFNKEADQLEADYHRHRIEMRKSYVEAAHEAYRRAKTLCGFDREENEFVDEFIARVETFYPSAADIRRRFNMEYLVFTVALPDLSRASYADLAEESEKVKMMQSAYEKALYRKASQFVDNIVTEQREKATEVLSRLSLNLRTGKRVTKATMNMVRKMVEDYEQMDLIGDDNFIKMLKGFKTRFVDGCDPKSVTENQGIRETALDELKLLIDAASNKTALTELTKRYRQLLGL